MSIELASLKKLVSSDVLDVLIRFAVIVLLVIMCDRILAPFWSILVWALILAVALFPLHQKLARKLGGKDNHAATLLILGIVLILGTPTVLLTHAFTSSIFDVRDAVTSDALHIPAPKETVKDWPIIGPKVFENWTAASTDTAAYIESMQPQFGNITRKILAATKNLIGTLFLFLGALIIAGVMMAYHRSGRAAMERVFTRFAGKSGPNLLNLSTATIRSVTVGVLGVAFVQSLLLGVGFVIGGVPFAGVLALIALVLGILQIPAALITLPVIAWIWAKGDASTVMNIALTIYLVLAALSDNVLKPMLLGRGVDAPMPVVLLGALGGMFSAGFIGLFIGAVGLAVGYQVFMAWVNQGVPPSPETEVREDPAQ